MYALHMNFTMTFNNVELTQENFEKVKSVFEDYPEVDRSKPDMLLLRNASQVITLAPKQISFGKNSNITEINIDEVITVFNKIITVLGTHDTGTLSLSTDCISFPKAGSIMEKSLGVKIPKPTDSIAIGFRYIIQNERILGEIKIEPYFKDNQRVFYSINLNSNGGFPSNNPGFIFKEFWSYIENIEGLANELYEY